VFKSILTICALIILFCVLIYLGNWQLDRLEWKTKILEDIKKQETTNPATIALNLAKNEDFQRGYIQGRFIGNKFIPIAPRTHEGQVGYHVIQPFETTAGDFILVNRGWIANGVEWSPFKNSQTVKIAGYLKKPDKKTAFTPPNNPENNLFYSLNINKINKIFNLNFYTKILYQEYPVADSADAPRTFSGLPKPRNNHAQYAAFWFGMAGLLLLLSGLRYWQFRRACVGAGS